MPIIEIVSYSFTSWNGISSYKTPVGVDNYIKILTTPKYFQTFINNLYYFGSGLLQIIIALYFAIILSFNVKLKSFFKASIVFPTLISGVAISMMFRMFYTPGGSFDTILTELGLEKWIHFWLGILPGELHTSWNFTLASYWTSLSDVLWSHSIDSKISITK